MIPVNSETPKVKKSTGALIFTLEGPSNSDGLNATSRSVPCQASNNPKAPPRIARSKLSTKSCRTMRARLAPSAARNPISFCRETPRARSRFATFVHAMSKTNPTAPSRMSRALRISPLNCVRSGTSRMPQLVLKSGYCCDRRAPIVFISACACSSVTPGLRRPTALAKRPWRSRNSFEICQGRHISAGLLVIEFLAMCRVKSLGSTPMTVKSRLLIMR